MAEIPGVTAKIGGDASGYIQAMNAAADASRSLEERQRALVDSLGAMGGATEKEKDQLLEMLRAAMETEQATTKWTDANQRAAMSMAAAHEQALKLNEAFGEGHSVVSEFGEEMLKTAGIVLTVGGGMELITKAVDLASEAIVGGVENFVEYNHGLELIHEKLNVPLEMAAAWQQTASVTGVSAEKMVSSLAMMDQRLVEGNDKAVAAVNAMGISFTELRDAAPADQVELLTQGLEHVADAGGKADVVIKELMGRGGLADLPALTPEAAALRKEIEEINGPLEQQVAETQKYEAAMALLGAETSKVRREIIEPLVGGLPDWIDRVNTGIGNIDSAMHRLGNNEYFQSFAALGKYAIAETGYLDELKAAAEAAGRVMDRLSGGSVSGFAEVGKPIPEETTIVPNREAAEKAEAERAAREKLRQEQLLDSAQDKIDAETKKAWTDASDLATKAEIDSLPPLDAAIAKAEDSYDKTTAAAYAKLAAAQATDVDTSALLEATNAEILNAGAVRDAAIAKATETQATKDAAAATKEAAADARVSAEVDAIAAKASEDLAKAHHDKGEAIDFATQKTIVHIEQEKALVEKLFAEQPALRDAMIATLNKAEADVTAAGAAQKHTAELQKIGNALQETAQLIGAVSEAFDEMGIHASTAFQREMAGAEKAAAGAGEAVQGYASGNYLQMVIGIVHFTEGVYQFFHAPETEKIVDDVGKQWGVTISDNLSKAIESTESKDQVSRSLAELLNLDAIMGESGESPDQFSWQIQALMNAVKLHAVDAAEGVKQLGGAFTALEQSAAAGSVASEAAMIQMIQRARQLGENIPEIQAFITSTLQSQGDDLSTFFAGQGDQKGKGPAQWTPGQSSANETILGASFGALASQEGVTKAAEDLQKAFDELMTHVPKDLPMDIGLQHMAEIEDLLKDANFKGAADASAAGADALKGLLDTGNLNQETATAFATATEGLLQQSIDVGIQHGLGPDEARIAGEEANLPMLTQLQHAQELGTKLDPTAQAMLTQAQTDGVLPLKTVAEQQLDKLREIAANTAKNGGGGGGNAGAGNGAGAGPGEGNGPGDPGERNGGGPRDPGDPDFGRPEGMATGGYVPASPGGRLIRAGEGGEGEYVVPASKMGGFAGGNQTVTENIYVAVNLDGQKLCDALARRIRQGYLPIDATSVRGLGSAIQGALTNSVR